MDLEYSENRTAQTLVLSSGVIEHIASHRQLRSNQKEAGGQLFATFEHDIVCIQLATGPRRADKRSRFRFIPHRVSERREIKRLFKTGLHYVGDWHTHPEVVPRPSTIDLNNMADMFSKSHHNLAGFVMIIAGTSPPPEGLFVGICDDKQCTELSVIA